MFGQTAEINQGQVAENQITKTTEEYVYYAGLYQEGDLSEAQAKSIQCCLKNIVPVSQISSEKKHPETVCHKQDKKFGN